MGHGCFYREDHFMNKPKWTYVYLMGLVFIILTACSPNPAKNQGAPSGTGSTGNAGGSSAASYGRTGTGLPLKNVGSGAAPVGMHHNTMMSVNSGIADQIAALPEVKSASVVATESNTYVAVRLKDNFQTTPVRRQAVNQATAAPQPKGDIVSGITGNSYDLKNDNTADMPTSSDVPAEIKQKIVDKVRSLSHPSLHHVYVSANPDFRTILESYTHDVKQGKSISGAIDDFNILAQRIFPTTDGTGAYGGSTSSGGPGKVYENSGDVTSRISRQR
jgi:YhcN/YlaJ family sporulation lipoprotein